MQWRQSKFISGRGKTIEGLKARERSDESLTGSGNTEGKVSVGCALPVWGSTLENL